MVARTTPPLPADAPSGVKLLDVPSPTPPPAVVHLRAPSPIRFPEEEEVPEGKEHLVVRTFLFQLLRFALGPEHTVGSDQFIYWNAREPARCLSPDVFVRVGRPDTLFGSWKTWAHGGAPHLAVEIISPNEGDGIAWEEKLRRYHELGVEELVRFDPRGREGARLRVWDRVEEDLVERRVERETSPCLTLRSTWVVRPVEEGVMGLRLLDARGELVLDARETEARRAAREEQRAAAEAERAAAEAERAAREQARAAQEAEARVQAEARAEAAEARLRALEAELARRGG
jgi:Uma2 family endonuclease